MLNPLPTTFTFSGSYPVPPDSCGPYVDTLMARGYALCTGAAVTVKLLVVVVAVCPPAVTEIGPSVAPAGTVAVMLVSEATL